MMTWIAALILSGAAQAQTSPSSSPIKPDPSLSAYARPGGLVDIGGRRIDLRCMGSGGPTVILMPGLGAFSMTWRKVHPVIAKRVRTCSFDRASYGHSDPAPLPQSLPDVVDDLRAALKVKHIAGPYVLVAHSLAGIEARLLAQRWPDEVAGMVLVDSSFAEQRMVMATMPGYAAMINPADKAKALACIEWMARPGFGPASSHYADCVSTPPPDAPADLLAAWPGLFRPSTFASDISLYDTLLSRKLDSVDHIDFGTKPLVVLTAGKTFSDEEDPPEFVAAYRPVWFARHEALSLLSSRGVHIFLPDAGHAIHRERPDVAIDAVNRVLDALGGDRK